MQITLSRTSDVPLRQQLAEQIVFLITTGQLKTGEELPSVRTLARMTRVHHNTVSEAYQDLVRRGWASRRRGSRLLVGTGSDGGENSARDLDDLISGPRAVSWLRPSGYTIPSAKCSPTEARRSEWAAPMWCSATRSLSPESIIDAKSSIGWSHLSALNTSKHL